MKIILLIFMFCTIGYSQENYSIKEVDIISYSEDSTIIHYAPHFAGSSNQYILFNSKTGETWLLITKHNIITEIGSTKIVASEINYAWLPIPKLQDTTIIKLRRLKAKK